MIKIVKDPSECPIEIKVPCVPFATVDKSGTIRIYYKINIKSNYEVFMIYKTGKCSKFNESYPLSDIKRYLKTDSEDYREYLVDLDIITKRCNNKSN